jgi:hypothetical protein
VGTSVGTAEVVAVSALEGATFVPRFLDGSLHSPQGNDVYVHVRLSEPARPADAMTVYLADGTALVVRGRDLVRLARVDDVSRR